MYPKFLWLTPCPAQLLKAWSSQILFGLKPTEDSLADLLVLKNSVHPQFLTTVLARWDKLGQPVNHSVFFWSKYPNWLIFKISLRENFYKYVFKFQARAQHISAVSMFKFIFERKTQIPCRTACTATKGTPFKVVNAVVCAISALNLNFLIFYERRLMKAVNVHLDSEVSAILL